MANPFRREPARTVVSRDKSSARFVTGHTPAQNVFGQCCCYTCLMSFNQVCERIAASLEMSRVVSKAVDPVARSFSMGRVSGLEEALRILQAEQAARTKAAAHGRKGETANEEQSHEGFFSNLERGR